MNEEKENIVLLVGQISDSNLYKEVILQVKKDFELIGQTIEINEFIEPADFIKEVYQQIHHLLRHSFDTYLQLLYRVDIPEKLMNFNTQNSDNIAKTTIFYILHREWEKVKLRTSFQ